MTFSRSPFFIWEEAQIELYEIIKAIRNYELYLLSIGGFDTEGKPKLSRFSTNFEDIICEYVCAMEELKRVKSFNKRACVYYGAIGYLQWQIADKLHINQSTVSRNLSWLKNFFKKNA